MNLIDRLIKITLDFLPFIYHTQSIINFNQLNFESEPSFPSLSIITLTQDLCSCQITLKSSKLVFLFQALLLSNAFLTLLPDQYR